MKSRALLPLWVLLWLCWLCASVVAAGFALDAPSRTAKGDAFLARAVSEKPVHTFRFHWQGKSIPVQAVHSEGLWQGLVLLPVDLDAKEGKGRLSVVSVGEEKQNPERVGRDIVFFEKKRPVQRLTVDKKYVSPPADQLERIRADREKVRAAMTDHLPQRHWSLPFARPVPGEVSSLFGARRIFNGQPRGTHRGLDLRAAEGVPVTACADGRVVLTDDLYFAGNAVYLHHGEGVFTAYLHLSEISVQQGDMVRQGQMLGRVGATGRVTGPHLHLSLLVQGVSVDPQPFLAPAPGTTEQ